MKPVLWPVLSDSHSGKVPEVSASIQCSDFMVLFCKICKKKTGTLTVRIEVQNVASALENSLSAAELSAAAANDANPLGLSLQPLIALHRGMQR